MNKSKMEITSAGDKTWRNAQGQLHNEEGPAVIWADGTKFWYINNGFHREDGPARIYFNGRNFWWINGKKIV